MPRIRAFRILAAVLALACSAFFLLAGFAGGLHRDDQTDRAITLSLAAAIGAGAAFAPGERHRLAALLLAACAAFGLAWDVAIEAPLVATTPFWAALAIAGGLCWPRAEEA